MSYLAFLAVPEELEKEFHSCFDPMIFISEASDFAISRSLRDTTASWKLYSLRTGAGSEKLLGQVGKSRRTHNNDKSQLLIDGVEKFLKMNGGQVVFFYHLFRGHFATEEAVVAGREAFDFETFRITFQQLESDTVYLVSLDTGS